jgi:hypothetical protein
VCQAEGGERVKNNIIIYFLVLFDIKEELNIKKNLLKKANCPLKLGDMKQEFRVIVDQHATVKQAFVMN